MNIVMHLLWSAVILAVGAYVLILGGQSGRGSSLILGLGIIIWGIYVLFTPGKSSKATSADRTAKENR